MDNTINSNNIKEMNILSLSFMGDAVHTLYIREKVLHENNLLVGDYHKKCIKYCSAIGQSYVFDIIENEFNEEEKEIARRARNAKSHKAKNSSLEDYKKATAFEAVFGYLYLTGQLDRLLTFQEMSYHILKNKGDAKC